MSWRLKRSVLVMGDRDGSRVTVDGPVDMEDGRRGWIVLLFRVVPCPPGVQKHRFEVSLDKRGVEWSRVRDDSQTVYEVWGPYESLERLSRERDVIGEPWFSTDEGVPGYQRPSPFGRQFRK